MRVSAIAACCVLLSTSPVFATHQLANGRITIDFGDGGVGQDADVVSSATWVDSSGKTTPNLVSNSQLPGCGDPGEFFGESYGDTDNGTLLMVWSGASSTWTSTSGTSGVSTLSGEEGNGCGKLIGQTTTAYTLGAYAAAKNEMKITRTFTFFSPDGVQQTDNLRAYVPRVDVSKYNTVVYLDSKGMPQTVSVSTCPTASSKCEIADWNGIWVADDDGQGNGIVLIRDKSSKAPAKIAIDNDLFSLSNATSILLMKPKHGWRGKLTETEWLCFYDAKSWPADQRTKALPTGCTRA